MQDVALVELHESVDVSACCTVEVEAVKVSVGARGVVVGVTPTVTCLKMLPPAPVQVSPYVVVAVGVTICEPKSDFDPLQPFEAVHDVAFVENHESVEDAPNAIAVGFAVNKSVGSGSGCTPQNAGSISGRARRSLRAACLSQRRLISCGLMLAAFAKSG